MTAPADRSQRAAEAERAVRRGDLKEALLLYRAILAQAPDDAAAKARVASIEALLQPSELAAMMAAPAPTPAPAPREKSLTAEQDAERLFEEGNYPGALAAYQQILEKRPTHQLARERIEELKGLVAAFAPQPVVPRPLKDRESILADLLSRIGVRKK